MEIKLPKRQRGRRSFADREEYEQDFSNFAQAILELSQQVDMKVSARGWCYLMEGVFRLINKDQFDVVEDLINDARKAGLIPIDFVLEDGARKFDNLEQVDYRNPLAYLWDTLGGMKEAYSWYEGISFWEAQPVYIQLLVEKIDLKTLFSSVVDRYHIPIANTKGWSSILQRARMAKRFAHWEAQGKRPVLLYCGDFDPVGLQISEKLMKNLEDIEGGTGWSPQNLEIDRFGLNFDLIQSANLTWIDNLISGSGKPPNYKLAYIQDYIAQYGERKVEANALIVNRELASQLIEDTINKYLPSNAFELYQEALGDSQNQVKELQNNINLNQVIDNLLEKLL